VSTGYLNKTVNPSNRSEKIFNTTEKGHEVAVSVGSLIRISGGRDRWMNQAPEQEV